MLDVEVGGEVPVDVNVVLVLPDAVVPPTNYTLPFIVPSVKDSKSSSI